MKSRSSFPKIAEITDFLYINLDFFAAPFIPEKKFQEWGKAHKNLLTPLSNDLKRSLQRKCQSKKAKHYDLSVSFADALIGMVFKPDDHQRSLQSGDTRRMNYLLIANSRLITAIQEHMNDPVINEWYKDQGQEIQEERENKKRALLIGKYQQASRHYQEYLQDVIAKEIDHINDKNTLARLSQILDKASHDTSASGKTIKLMPLRQTIRQNLLKNYSQFEDGINEILKNKPNFILALQKYKIVMNGKIILRSTHKESAIVKFHRHLADNKATLTKRRDSGFTLFTKSLDVTVAAQLSADVGGYFTYQRFFGYAKTEGNKHMNTLKEAQTETAQISNRVKCSSK